jgi:hypothetical protein
MYTIVRSSGHKLEIMYSPNLQVIAFYHVSYPLDILLTTKSLL